MRKLDPEKLSHLSTYNKYLDEKYGKSGSSERAQFDKESLEWFEKNIKQNPREATPD